MNVFRRLFRYGLVGSSNKLLIALVLIATSLLAANPVIVYAMAADCVLERNSENYIGVRYKAVLVEDELSETGWVLLFGGSRFTSNGEYNCPHLIDLMIKGSWANVFTDPLCANGFPAPDNVLDNFTIEFGLSDYEDGVVQDNDIGVWSEDPLLFPRVFTNIDSTDPNAADKIMAEYQVEEGGTLEGREIEVSLVRAEQTTLGQDNNYFMDPDLPDSQCCRPNSQADILYRRWIATLKVPSLGIDSSVDFYINASQGDKIHGAETLNLVWENPDRPSIETDKYKVIIFDPEVSTTPGDWEKATRFMIDYRTQQDHLPLDEQGQMVGGYRKVYYKGFPAIEASFGYGYTDYMIDGDPTNYEPTDATKAMIDLQDSATTLVSMPISLKSGWNMVSVPLILGNSSVDAVFPGVAAVYTWDPVAHNYIVPATIEPGTGYWVAVTEDTTITATGVHVTNWTEDISAGWNMTGSLITDASLTDPSDNPDDSVQPFAYWWNPTRNSYAPTTYIQPGEGYWVASTRDCTLSLP